MSRRRRSSFSNYNSDSKIRMSSKQIFDMLKTEIELENKDIAATKFYSLVSRDSPALLRPLPLSRRRGDTRLHHPHPPGYEGQPLRERERERERESRFSGLSC